MYYTLYKRYHPEDILVYIEEYNKQNRTILFDFVDSNEYNRFIDYANLNTNVSDVSIPSMVYLSNYKSKAIRENTIYAIPREVILNWNELGLINSNVENSFLIGYTVDLSKSEGQVFAESVSINDFYDLRLHHLASSDGSKNKISPIARGKLSVTIRNVGQGNWNEIEVNNSVKYVYDAGAPMLASRADVMTIIGNKPAEYSSARPGLFLSHWDKDHYHSLIAMSDTELAYFSFLVCRDRLLNRTTRILYNRLKTAIGSANTFTLPAERRTSRGGPTYLIPVTPTNRQITLYNAQHNKNRNISGIVLSVKTKNSSIILAGDVHYDQISRDVLPHLAYKHSHNVIVPHHGGNAGPYVYNVARQVSLEKAIISVGPNNYHHPMPQYTVPLNNDWLHVMQTQIIGSDITVKL